MEAVDDLLEGVEVERDQVVDLTCSPVRCSIVSTAAQRAAVRAAVGPRSVDPVVRRDRVSLAVDRDVEVAREREQRERVVLRVGAEEHERVGVRARVRVRARARAVVVAGDERDRRRRRRLPSFWRVVCRPCCVPDGVLEIASRRLVARRGRRRRRCLRRSRRRRAGTSRRRAGSVRTEPERVAALAAGSGVTDGTSSRRARLAATPPGRPRHRLIPPFCDVLMRESALRERRASEDSLSFLKKLLRRFSTRRLVACRRVARDSAGASARPPSTAMPLRAA